MAKRTQENTLFKYLVKKSKLGADSEGSTENQCSSDFDSDTATSSSSTSGAVPGTVDDVSRHILDVGYYTGSNIKIDDDLKYRLLKYPWMPEKTFKFPVSDDKRKLKFQIQWIERFSWLVYTSTGQQGALCKYCVLFARDCAGKGSHQQLKSLVTKPLTKWKDAVHDFKHHSESQYHKSSVLLADNFMKVYNKSQPNIMSQIDSGYSAQIAANRKRLIPIIETIKLCGRQELALRGTCDSGPIKINDPEPETNDGNFRAIVRMRSRCGDSNLIKHMENMTLNATYLSPTIQNELIAICGEIVQKKIVQGLNSAKFFSILVDETTDVSRQEQMSICVRYAEPKDNVFILREDFLTFVTVENTKGKYLANAILSELKSLGVDCEYLIGQGYDGASSMKGSFKGVQAVIRESHPEALYVHCSSHSLNLALGHSCQVQPIRNTIGIIKSVGNFIKSSAKRTKCLKDNIEKNFPETQWKNLTAMCETRWVENHDGLLRFKEIYKAIVDTLDDLSTDMDCETSSKANSFLRSVISSDFVISLCCLGMLFPYTLTLCKILQSPICDLAAALQHVDLIIKTIEDVRQNIDSKFAKLFLNAQNLLCTVNEEIKIPRITSRQEHRANYNTKDPETYFRITIMIPLLDDFIDQLQSRFQNHKATLSSLNILIPSVCCKEQINSKYQENSFELYKKYLEWDFVKAELDMWRIKWMEESELDRPTCAIEALGECNQSLFPNIHKLLKILATLPVSTCTPERTFSSLKRLKTYLRNSTSQERLNGLALMSIHRRIDIDTEEVIDLFAAKKARKLNLIL